MSPHRRQIDKENNIYQFRNNGNAELDTNNAQIGQSGNSDVDVYVNIEIDTKPIAYALLSSLLATKQITRFEFEEAIKNLEKLTKKQKKHIPGLRFFGPLKDN
ncbi:MULTISPECIES: hypothetical protein [Bacillaceae]|uniref:hypothetical protein n=1 Tax=Bacillaceae TaxID=186817 RepID=UPI001E28CF73|nr:MULTISPECIES: hypothetical protein [Bacillaceae]MCE4050733.1 hypothetical protein [Bacillus sp. Au-Bac7]MCM3031646.1 hypothetical protein [Niallia sp. MER 6]UPO89834.1 hypothetical protein L8T27_023865 [Niallia sp. Man26]